MNEVNPYAPPEAEERSEKRGSRAAFAGTPRPWSTNEVFGLAWERVRAQKWVLARATFLEIGLPQLVAQIPRWAFELEAQGVVRADAASYAFVVFASQITSLFLTCFFNAGACKIWLDVARGKEARFGDIFGGLKRTPSLFGTVMLMSIAIGAGTLFLVIPGIVVAAGFSVAMFFVVDAEMGPFRALSSSWEVTKGHRLALFGFGIMAMLVMMLGTVACFVGILLAYPTVYVALAIVYLRISGRGRKKKKKAPAVEEKIASDVVEAVAG